MRALTTVEGREASALACPWCGDRADRAVEGFRVTREGRVLGALLWTPGDAARDLCPARSILVERLWVAPSEVSEHIGSQLVLRACGVARGRGVRHLVARGTRGRPDCSTLPAGWLERVGFVEHVAGVQWRLELSRTAPVQEALRQARDAVTGLVRGRQGAHAVGGQRG